MNLSGMNWRGSTHDGSSHLDAPLGRRDHNLLSVVFKSRNCAPDLSGEVTSSEEEDERDVKDKPKGGVHHKVQDNIGVHEEIDAGRNARADAEGLIAALLVAAFAAKHDRRRDQGEKRARQPGRHDQIKRPDTSNEPE